MSNPHVERVYKVIGTFKAQYPPETTETYTVTRRYLTKRAAMWRKNYWEKIGPPKALSVLVLTSWPIIYPDENDGTFES